jgi:uncharacterized repeat protein (TIGR03847 family)
MTEYLYDLKKVSNLTAGAVGQPGARVFYLQAQKHSDLLSMIAEKEQIRALCLHIDNVIDELERRGINRPAEADEPTDAELHLRGPLNPLFRIGQLSMAYDSADDLLVIEVGEFLTSETEEEVDPLFQSAEEPLKSPVPRLVRLSATRAQMKGMSRHAMDIIVTGGRPICPQCLQSMDSEGHLCVKKNGHGNKHVEH